MPILNSSYEMPKVVWYFQAQHMVTEE